MQPLALFRKFRVPGTCGMASQESCTPKTWQRRRSGASPRAGAALTQNRRRLDEGYLMRPPMRFQRTAVSPPQDQ